MGKVQGGVLMKTILTSHGQHLLREVLGPQYLSILPIVLSFLVMVLARKKRQT